MLVCCWWSFARLIAAFVTTTYVILSSDEIQYGWWRSIVVSLERWSRLANFPYPALDC